jgi:(1->4)-alpha-D-glucan 1-alpha-D-glucosylmutase
MAEIPNTTYRLQLRSGFGFADAERLVPYLDRLGISHLYIAPPFTARKASTHGYDVADANELDPTLGGMPAFEKMAAALREHGMGLIIDIVPNHMGVGPDNPWWWDVLKHGRESAYAGFFDIDFDRDSDGKLVLPVLGSALDEILDKSELKLAHDEARGEPILAYYDTPFPLAPGSEKAGDVRRVLERQAYRLTFWRESEQRNYRRFFDIGELGGLRVEIPEVFEAAHALIFDLVKRGLVQGLRIDHVDGLSDPKGYLVRLQQRLKEITGSAEPFYVVVEKILSGDEPLPPDWPVAGTTGYEFLNQVLGLLIDPAGLEPLERLRAEMTGEPAPFPEVVDKAKRLVLEKLFAGELKVLGQKAEKLLDLPETDVTAAILELLVAFKVYRTYRRREPLSRTDRAVLDRAFGAAGERLTGGAATALIRLRTLFEEEEPDEARQGWLNGFQQLSGPVIAKALEDTAFYRFPRLLALNEVGGEPDAHGVPPEKLHALNMERLERWPHTMLTTATHDTKRGEDARARLVVLSELPEEWAATVRGWRGQNAAVRPDGLHPKDEYTLYQALVGVWPIDLRPTDTEGLSSLRERVQGYLTKALREGKERTSWLDQDQAYEEAVLGFAAALLDPATSGDFLTGLSRFVARIAPAGAANALSQLLVKLTSPGVPDNYQGTELWDLSLVDPDNRRPVDWRARESLLNDAPADWNSGAVKLQVLARALALRREVPELFAAGDYLPLQLTGVAAEHAFAFARRHGDSIAITLVGRHLARLIQPGEQPSLDPAGWRDTTLVLPEPFTDAALHDRLTGTRHTASGGRLPLRSMLTELPVALLVGGG